jgi:N-acetylglucosamine repressor
MAYIVEVMDLSFSGIHGNNDFIKKLNLGNVLRTLIANQPTSRAKIAALTGLNKATVSSCIDHFIEKGIVIELGTTETTRGRPPTLLQLHHKAGLCVGIEVEYKEQKIVIADLGGNELERRTIDLSSDQPEYFVELLSRLIADIKHRYSAYPLGILGIGIATAGYYNKQSGIVEYIANLQSWNQFPILSEVQKIDPSIRYFIDSTVNAGAIGELRQHKKSPPEVFVYVGGLWGLGVGICIHGKVFSGNLGFAGRLGHSTIDIDGKRCRCGNRGCWELYASADALYQRVFPEEVQPSKNFEAIVNRLRSKDPQVLEAVDELGSYQAVGLANVINAYNPDVICIGGYLGMLSAPLVHAINRRLSEVLPQHFLENVTIYCSGFGEFGAATGAISIVQNHLSDILIAER